MIMHLGSSQGVNLKEMNKCIHCQLKKLSCINGLILGIRKVGFPRKCKNRCEKIEQNRRWIDNCRQVI